jgi:hypothetical protein
LQRFEGNTVKSIVYKHKYNENMKIVLYLYGRYGNLKDMRLKKWPKEKCQIEALKYKTRTAFQKGSSSASQIAYLKGWLDEICTHMVPNHVDWTKELVFTEALKYKTISQFQKASPGAYKAAVRFSLLYEACSHMPRRVVPDRTKPLQEVVKELAETHGNLVKIKEESYIKSSGKAIFIDSEFGEWTSFVYSVIKGSSHPQRAKQKIKETCIKKYGTECSLQNEQIKDKTKSTILKKYGTNNVSSNKQIQAKKKATTFKNYGVEYPSQSIIVKNKAKNTNLKKYGTEYSAQNHEVGLRVARTSNITTVKNHWKTNEELVCQGGYEAKVVDYLNTNKIEYLWQPKTFKTPNGKTYRPDLYLVKEAKWVEIKGYMRKDAQEKWSWFLTQYPNSELWNKEKLKEFKIIP